MRQCGEPCDLNVGGIVDADTVEVMVVKAGQHGDANNLGMQTGGCLGILHHCAPAAGMDGDNCGFEHVDRLHRLGDGVGDIMQLEVEENRKAEFLHLMHAMMAIGAEKLEAQFHPADMCLDPAGQIERVVQPRGVDCDVEWIAHAAFSDVAVGAGKFAAMVFAPLSNVEIRRFSR